jgi:hypothetical protein
MATTNGSLRALGSTGLQVFPLCLGGNVFGWTADEDNSFAVLDAYVAAGGNFIDTANGYSRWVPGHDGGESERVIGAWLAKRGKRDDVIVATKLGSDGGLTPDNVRARAEESLERLQSDHVDIMYAHYDDLDTPPEVSLAALDELVKEGKVRHLAASNFTPERLDEAIKTRIDSERNQGRAPDMGWLDHDRLGFNYRLTDIACAIGIAQLDRLDDMLAARARVAGWYRELLGGIDGLELPFPDTDGDVRGWFVFVVQLPRGVDRDDTVRALREHGVQSKPYLPAIHLMSFYRERFGHRPGEFPVCEDVAERSLALPFFPELTQGQAERVAQALRAVVHR